MARGWNDYLDRVKLAASGQWSRVLVDLGFPAEVLDGKHHPCPRCGGHDRFRMIDAAAGAVLCNACFGKDNGDGLATLSWYHGWTFKETVQRVGELLNVANGKQQKTKASIEQVKLQTWHPTLVNMWCRKKAPIKAEIIQEAGGQVARYRDYNCVALPVNSLIDPAGEPQAWVIWQLNGKPMPAAKGRPPAKMKTIGRVAGGLIGRAGLQRLADPEATIDVVWLVAGPSDLLALLSVLPNDRRGRHIVLANAGGENQKPQQDVCDLLSERVVYLVRDTDETGEAGGQRWSEALSATASECRWVKLPYPPTKTHGKDLRDYLAEGHTYDELLELAAQSEIIQPPAENSASEAAATKDEQKPLANAEVSWIGDSREVVARPISEIVEDIAERTDGWPRRVGGGLFAHESQGIRRLHNTPSLFGWLQSRCGVVEWHRANGCATKEELFHELRWSAADYAAIEYLPHEPVIPKHYYACEIPEPGDGSHLDELLSRFVPWESADLDLLKVMFATSVWGGPPGSRPMFVLTSPDGRGAGKSKTTDVLAALMGGLMDFGASDDPATMRQRILSPGADQCRLLRIDNIKSHRFSWAELESLVTAQQITGKRMYEGEASRSNYYTWLLTLNGVSLSTDVAQRAVIIQVRKPRRIGTWEVDTMKFVEEHRTKLLADLVGFLRRPQQPFTDFSRWAHWESDVLARLDDPGPAKQLINERRGQADAEAEEFGIIEEHFYQMIEKHEYDPARSKVFISSKVAANWYAEATGDKRPVITVSRILSQAIEEGRLQWVQRWKGSKGVRGFIWDPKHPEADPETISYSLERRIQDHRNGGGSSSRWAEF